MKMVNPDRSPVWDHGITAFLIHKNKEKHPSSIPIDQDQLLKNRELKNIASSFMDQLRP
jgi:hypothetical protein